MANPLNTGIQIFTAIQAASANARLTAFTQGQEQKRVADQATELLKQNLFVYRKSLGESLQILGAAPHDALYSAELVVIAAHLANENLLTDLKDKEYLYELRKAAIQLRDQAYGKIENTHAEQIRRLAWLKLALPYLEVLRDWCLIEETMKARSFLFFPARLGFTHFIVWFIGAVVVTQMVHMTLGLNFRLICLPTPFLIGYLRKTVVQKCDLIARRAGGSIGKYATISQASKIKDLSREDLRRFGYSANATNASEADREIAEINREIQSIHESMVDGVVLKALE